VKNENANATGPSPGTILITTGKHISYALLAVAMLLARIVGMAQELEVHIEPQSQPGPGPVTSAGAANQAAQNPNQPPAPVKVILPAGTKIVLGLLRPLSFKHTKPGDTAYMQATFPVSTGNQMVIPPGTYVQGIIDKITRRDRSERIMSFDLRSAAVILSTGYTVTISGPLAVQPSTAQAVPSPIFGTPPVPVMAAAAGQTLPPLPPLPKIGPSPGTIAGIAAGGLAASVVLAVVFAHNHDVQMRVGSPIEITLPAPLEFDQDRLAAAIHDYAVKAAIAPPQIVQPPKRMMTCWTDGTPGTPDTVIPGTPDTVIPGTPDVTIPGDPPTVIPGTPPTVIPGTPPTVIPGSPGTPGTSYPCPE
jgi:hypothetical protein